MLQTTLLEPGTAQLRQPALRMVRVLDGATPINMGFATELSRQSNTTAPGAEG
jgi:hypothetical protein